MVSKMAHWPMNGRLASHVRIQLVVWNLLLAIRADRHLSLKFVCAFCGSQWNIVFFYLHWSSTPFCFGLGLLSTSSSFCPLPNTLLFLFLFLGWFRSDGRLLRLVDWLRRRDCR